MTLSEWLKANEIRRMDFAKMLGVSKGYITQLCEGARPSMSVAERICRVTKGDVTPNDFMRLKDDSQPTP
jgi:3,4-dihydroxy 2-butanone 4-phosphate synthase/GTP cyclohydrolase II